MRRLFPPIDSVVMMCGFVPLLSRPCRDDRWTIRSTAESKCLSSFDALRSCRNLDHLPSSLGDMDDSEVIG